MKTKEKTNGRSLDEADAKPPKFRNPGQEQPTADKLMRQAAYTANYYMISAKEDIDLQFGEGHAEAHPELVGAYMNAAALDFLGTFLHCGLEKLSDSTWDAVEDISIALGHISTALEERQEVE